MTDDRSTLFSRFCVRGESKVWLAELVAVVGTRISQYLHDFAIRYIAVAQLVFAPVTEEQQRKAAGAI